MSDPIVTVARFRTVMEAELAKNFLDSEGIVAQIVGDKTAILQIGALGGLAEMYVKESDAERAAELLAEHFEKAKLAHDWMDRVGDDVWLCPLCGEAISDNLDECAACSTRREGIQVKDRVTGKRWAPPRPEPKTEVTVNRPPAAEDSPHAFDPGDLDLEPLGGERNVPRDLRLNPGDEAAGSALLWAFIGLALPIVMFYSCYLLIKLSQPDTEFSRSGRTKYWWAFILNLAAICLWLSFVVSRLRHLGGP